MVDKDWYVGVGGEQFDGWIENFFGFNYYFLFFFGCVVFYEGVDVGDDVEGNLFGKSLWFDFVIDVDVFGLGLQFVYGCLVIVGY